MNKKKAFRYGFEIYFSEDVLLHLPGVWSAYSKKTLRQVNRSY